MLRPAPDTGTPVTRFGPGCPRVHGGRAAAYARVVDDRGRGGWPDEALGDPGHSDEPEPHLWHLRLHMPDDQRRMGLDARTEEGALVEFASALDGRRPAHRLVAWVLLVTFGVPAALSAVHLLGLVLDALR